MYKKKNENSDAEIGSPQAREVSSQSTGPRCHWTIKNLKLKQTTKPNGDKSMRWLHFESSLILLLSSAFWLKIDK